MKYDVFISYSRKDYVDENENVLPDSPVKVILDFLDEKGVTYWFDKKGLYKGAEFVEVIADAIATSKMMIFLSSTNSNESIYTAGEIFEAIECGKLIIPIRVDDSKYNKKFKLLVNPLDYIDYSQKDAFDDLLKAIEYEKNRIAKVEAEEQRRREEEERRKREEREKLEEAERIRREEEEREAKRNAVLESIYEQIVQVDNHHIAQHNLKKTIYEQLCSIEITEKDCPVCHTKCNLDVEYCPVCGWHFNLFSYIPQLSVEVSPEEQIALANFSALWGNKNSNKDYELLKSEKSSLEDKLTEIKDAKTELTNVCNNLSKERDDLRDELEKLKSKKPVPDEHHSKGRLVLDGILRCFGVLGLLVVLMFVIKKCEGYRFIDPYDYVLPDSVAVDSTLDSTVNDTTDVDTPVDTVRSIGHDSPVKKEKIDRGSNAKTTKRIESSITEITERKKVLESRPTKNDRAIEEI